MTTSPSPTTALERLLSNLTKVDGLADDVRASLGLHADADLADAGVLGHFADLGEVLSLYVVTSGHLSIHQRTQQGRSLTISVGLERLSRVTAERDGSGVAVSFELDAEKTTTTTTTEFVEGPDDNTDTVEDRRGVARSQSTTVPTSYRLVAADPGDAGERDLRAALGRFHVALVGALRG